MYVDTHTHLYDPAYLTEGPDGCDAAVERAVRAGVEKLILPDTDSSVREGLFALAARHKGVCFPCLGLHPTEFTADNFTAEMDALEAAVRRTSGPPATERETASGQDADRSGGTRIVAIGETGLDYHYGKDTLPQQHEAFRAQIELAARLDLPLIVHCREAVADCLTILKDCARSNTRGVFHAYSGSAETFRELERMGLWYIGVGGVVTFKNASLARVVQEVPLERILLETDAPYLTPVPHRGERNESAYIPLIATRIARETGREVEEIEAITDANAHSLFGLS